MALSMMGEALLGVGRPAEAVGYLEEALTRGGSGPGLHDLLGLALADVGRFAEAESHFRRAVALDPSSALARAHLAAVEARVATAKHQGASRQAGALPVP
jgi:Flp pilus assembly protein TadD